MLDLVAELATRGRSLPPEQRVRLLDLLLESLHEPAAGQVEDAWSQEIERRVSSFERGDAVLHDLDDVMAEAVRIAP